MLGTAISEKWDHEFKSEQGYHMVELGRRKRKLKKLSNYVIISKKEKEEKSLYTMLYITYILVLLLKTY